MFAQAKENYLDTITISELEAKGEEALLVPAELIDERACETVGKVRHRRRLRREISRERTFSCSDRYLDSYQAGIPSARTDAARSMIRWHIPPKT